MAQLLAQRACAKLRSAIGDETLVRLTYSGDLQEMLDALEVIQPLLEKAGMHLLHARLSATVLSRIRDAADMIMDMVDELQDTRPPAATAMTTMLPRLSIKKKAMATNVVNKVVNMKDQLIDLKEEFHSYIYMEELAIIGQQQLIMDGRSTEPLFKEASVFGRGADKQRIVAVLLSAESNITQGPPNCIILPIFGFPGSGKTTLAQMVFKDDTHSLQEYNFRIWVHVGPELDFHRIGECILRQVVSGGAEKEGINDNDSNSDVVGMERMIKRLHELLIGKKVLLVLDDLWEEDPIPLELLKSMLTFLGDKVDVIVTTCNQAIARKICTVVPYRLNLLDDDTCWEIIKKSMSLEKDKVLERIGQKIARKCCRLPQRAIDYASLLVRVSDRTEWVSIIEQNLWDISRGLLETFFLSYSRMPPELRLGFDYYCDIFPNGHNIVKDDLVHLWIALDFIEPSPRSSATEIAEGYISRLLDMSFFQTAESDPASGNNDEGAAMFTMHNLAYEFSRWISDNSTALFVRHMLVTNFCGKLDSKHDNFLRALHCVGCRNVDFNDDSFSRKQGLRVVLLTESSVQKLPASICKLGQLGYLKISEFSGLVTLPESFGDLTNLFHIDLSDCSGLAALPESFGKLIRLVHVNLSGCSTLATFPESFGNLVNLLHINLSRCYRLSGILEMLRKLDKLVYLDLSFWFCFEGIDKCLGQLTNLEHLNLSNPCCYLPQQRFHLQKIRDVMGRLTKLRYLNLSMCLNLIFYYHQSQEESLQFIGDCLRGLSSLEHLDLSHNTFIFDLPHNLGDLDKLHTLNLSGCFRLKRIGEMKSLKFIALRNCRGLESCNFVVGVVDDEDAYRSSNIVQLEDVNCQELQISCLEKVRSKEEAQRIKLVEKQKLGKLKLSWTLDSIRSVEDSALLGELTPPSNVQCLEINGFNATCLPEYLGDLTSLRELKIVCCKQLKSFPDSIQKLTNLKDLCIFDCPELEKWCKLEEKKKMLAHIPNKNYEEHGSISRPEIEENCRSADEVEVA